MVGTPLYMSPGAGGAERAGRGHAHATSTRSGVLLYELLTGTTPFDRERLRDGGLRRDAADHPRGGAAAAEHAAEHAGTRRADRRRPTGGREPAKLSRLVRGELDWIVMKALEKDRNRRYETASALRRGRRSATWPTSRCRRARRRPATGCGSSPGGTGRGW